MTLIVSGLLLLGLIAYQLWGTGIQTREAQRSLEKDFQTLVTTTIPSSTTPGSTTPTSTTPITVEIPKNGEVIAHMVIPKMDLDVYVVEGVSYKDLRVGPGRYPNTPMIGQLGNAAIAGHRTTFGSPFGEIEKLEPGDDIILDTTYGRFTYQVTGYEVVRPTDVRVISNSTPDVATLTLTTCHPRFSSSKRYIVYSELVKQDAPSREIVVVPNKTDPAIQEPAVAFSEGWWHDSAAWSHVALWTAALLLIVGLVLLAKRLFSQRFRFTFPLALLLAAAPFSVCLYFFYQNLSRLLPTNI